MSFQTVFSQDIFTRPPLGDPRAPWTNHDIEVLVLDSIKVNASLVGISPEIIQLKLMDSEPWSEYVNNHHFVPLQADGLPPGYIFDYNWKLESFWEVPSGKKQRSLVTAEIIETGEFLFWWEKYNYYGVSDKVLLETQINRVVAHELFHYLQWQRVLTYTLLMGGYVKNMNREQVPILNIKIPASLNDLKKKYGKKASERFLNIWNDPAHYECREVEVYVTQFENGSNTPEKLGGEDAFAKKLINLRTYAYGIKNNPFAPGCVHSVWAPEFMPYILKTSALLSKYENEISVYESKK